MYLLLFGEPVWGGVGWGRKALAGEPSVSACVAALLSVECCSAPALCGVQQHPEDQRDEANTFLQPLASSVYTSGGPIGSISLEMQ